jgi:hypothetical protein
MQQQGRWVRCGVIVCLLSVSQRTHHAGTLDAAWPATDARETPMQQQSRVIAGCTAGHCTIKLIVGRQAFKAGILPFQQLKSLSAVACFDPVYCPNMPQQSCTQRRKSDVCCAVCSNGCAWLTTQNIYYADVNCAHTTRNILIIHSFTQSSIHASQHHQHLTAGRRAHHAAARPHGG